MWFITVFFFFWLEPWWVHVPEWVKGPPEKYKTNVIIIYLIEMKGEKLQSNSRRRENLNHLDFGDIYWRERIQSPPLGLSLPLSPPFSHPPLLSCCGCAVERRKEGEQEPTPTRAAANSCTAWALITDCPPITFLFCDLESPIYPLYICLFSVLCELCRLLGFPGLKIGLWTKALQAAAVLGFLDSWFRGSWIFGFLGFLYLPQSCKILWLSFLCTLFGDYGRKDSAAVPLAILAVPCPFFPSSPQFYEVFFLWKRKVSVCFAIFVLDFFYLFSTIVFPTIVLGKFCLVFDPALSESFWGARDLMLRWRFPLNSKLLDAMFPLDQCCRLWWKSDL